MRYEEFPVVEFWNRIATEEQAIELAWRYKTEDSGHCCPKCGRKKHYQHNKRPEIKECRHCGFQHRLRTKTIFENSKMPMLTWIRALYLMMQGKRGISALELQRQLKIGSYNTALLMLNRIRKALLERDKLYKLEGIIEFDGGYLGKQEHDNQRPILMAVESKSFIDKKGKRQPKAGFAKVFFAKEDNNNTKKFTDENIRITSELHTDGAKAYISEIEGVKIKSKPMYGDPDRLQEWLPWVHRFISNAKAWIVGTHHGVESQNFELYMAEYTYRFNRRHDHQRYFSRALYACMGPLNTGPPSMAQAA